jgi:hypothetical protein
MEVELDPLTLLEMGMGEDNIEIEVNRKCFADPDLHYFFESASGSAFEGKAGSGSGPGSASK